MSKLANREEKQYQEKLLKISRVSKTTKGGRTISFSVLAAVGDGEGRVGLGLGKANGVPDAIRKALSSAKKNLVDVSLKGSTIPHETEGKWGATTLWMAPAYEGTGVIAGSATREILEILLSTITPARAPTLVLLPAVIPATPNVRFLTPAP